jgi:muramidase (phage lysozyme)
MDQILVHMILASYPEASWEDVLPKLQSLQFEPASLDAIANHIKSPQPLGALLDQLNLDFAILTLSRAYAIAHLDGTISPEEAKVLDAIAEKFELDLESIKTTVNAAS